LGEMRFEEWDPAVIKPTNMLFVGVLDEYSVTEGCEAHSRYKPNMATSGDADSEPFLERSPRRRGGWHCNARDRFVHHYELPLGDLDARAERPDLNLETRHRLSCKDEPIARRCPDPWRYAIKPSRGQPKICVKSFTRFRAARFAVVGAMMIRPARFRPSTDGMPRRSNASTATHDRSSTRGCPRALPPLLP